MRLVCSSPFVFTSAVLIIFGSLYSALAFAEFCDRTRHWGVLHSCSTSPANHSRSAEGNRTTLRSRYKQPISPYVGSGPPPYGSDGYQGYLAFVATEAYFCYRSANDSDGYTGTAHRCRRFNVTNLTHKHYRTFCLWGCTNSPSWV